LTRTCAGGAHCSRKLATTKSCRADARRVLRSRLGSGSTPSLHLPAENGAEDGRTVPLHGPPRARHPFITWKVQDEFVGDLKQASRPGRTRSSTSRATWARRGSACPSFTGSGSSARRAASSKAAARKNWWTSSATWTRCSRNTATSTAGNPRGFARAASKTSTCTWATLTTAASSRANRQTATRAAAVVRRRPARRVRGRAQRRLKSTARPPTRPPAESSTRRRRGRAPRSTRSRRSAAPRCSNCRGGVTRRRAATRSANHRPGRQGQVDAALVRSPRKAPRREVDGAGNRHGSRQGRGLRVLRPRKSKRTAPHTRSRPCSSATCARRRLRRREEEVAHRPRGTRRASFTPGGRSPAWRLLASARRTAGRRRTWQYVFGVDISNGAGGSNSSSPSCADDSTWSSRSFGAPTFRPKTSPKLLRSPASGSAARTASAFIVWENNGPGGIFGRKAVKLGYTHFYYQRRTTRRPKRRRALRLALQPRPQGQAARGIPRSAGEG
jgi:hypothetical protein